MERIDLETLSSSLIENTQHTNRYIWANCLAFGKVLDAACGVGYGSKIINNKKVEYYLGIDISEESIKLAKKQFSKKEKIEFELSNIIECNLQSNSFDTIISFETIEHLKSPEKAIFEFKRILKQNGILIGSVPTAHYEKLSKIIFGKNKYHFSTFSLDKIKKIIATEFKYSKFLLFSEVFGTLITNTEKKVLKIKLNNYESIDLGSYVFVATNDKKNIPKIKNTNNFLYKSNIIELIKSDFLAQLHKKNKYIEELEKLNQSQENRIKIKDRYLAELEKR